MDEANYKAWKDRGDNIGIQCLSCGRTHWIADFNTVNPATGLDCENCVEIKEQNILTNQSEMHLDELSGELDCEHESAQKPAVRI